MTFPNPQTFFFNSRNKQIPLQEYVAALATLISNDGGLRVRAMARRLCHDTSSTQLKGQKQASRLFPHLQPEAFHEILVQTVIKA